MNDHDEMLDAIAVYALGAMSPEDEIQIAAHLGTCQACREEYHRLLPVVEAIGSSTVIAPSVATLPSVALKRRVLSVTRVRRLPIPWTVPAVAAALLLLAVLTGALAGRLAVENGRLHHALDLQTARSRDLAAARSRDETMIADFSGNGSRHYLVPGGAIITKDSRLYIAMHSMPKVPRGKVYQAWVLPKGQKRMSPSITFVPTNGAAVLRVPVNALRIAAIAVSVEPAGGSAQPTTKPAFVLKLSRGLE